MVEKDSHVHGMLNEELKRCRDMIISLRKELSNLPKGSLHAREKRYKGKKYVYHYLKYRQGGKSISRHVSQKRIGRTDSEAASPKALRKRNKLLYGKDEIFREDFEFKMKEIYIQHAEIFPLEIHELLRSLYESGFFSHGLLTGSWIFPLYEKAFKIRYPLKTFDIDFAVNSASLSSLKSVDLEKNFKCFAICHRFRL